MEGAANQFIAVSYDQEVAVIRVNSPNSPVNALGSVLSAELKKAFDDIEKNNAVKSVVVISEKPRCFFAGADINMLAKVTSAEEATNLSREAQQNFERIERSRKPVVAAIMGTCMGGGVELALACHYRLAVDTSGTVFAFPEVKIGLLPGAGGTQRLPKLVPIENALDMILTGRSVNAQKAAEIGLTDQLIPEKESEAETLKSLEETAITVSKELAAGTLRVNHQKSLFGAVKNYLLTTRFIFDRWIMQTAEESTKRLTKGHFPAPFEILKVIRSGIMEDSIVAYEKEAEGFGKLCQSYQSKALINLFHARNVCKRNRYGKKAKIQEIAFIFDECWVDLIIASFEAGIKVHMAKIDETRFEKLVKEAEKRLARRRLSKPVKELLARHFALKEAEMTQCSIVFCRDWKEVPEFPISAVVVPRSKDQSDSENENVLALRYNTKTKIAQIVPFSGTKDAAVATVADFFGMMKEFMVVKAQFDCQGFYEEVAKLASQGNPVSALCEEFGFLSDVVEDARREGYNIEEAKKQLEGAEDVPVRLAAAMAKDALEYCSRNEKAQVDMDILGVAYFGFPAHWGGPLKFLDLYGRDKLAAAFEHLQINPELFSKM
ncbi:hypothetical protein L596_028977 [Steinernema carpocapsae]|uniref:enoyl-CoA hydratase n=1 Tax=Steinernema carpocapsae TaxID=34508 RepID=A0A4U5LT93_STECR|nr:hypothetical protein L596_028977 [Steinernema carpocapsae]